MFKLKVFILLSLVVVAYKLGVFDNAYAFAQSAYTKTRQSTGITLGRQKERAPTPNRPTKTPQAPTQPIPPVTPPTSPTPPTPTHSEHGNCGESNDVWHGAVVNNCQTGHEHGDEPPSWVTSSRWHPMFTHAANTPNENMLKHSSFKGFSFRDDNTDVYIIMHLDTNPNGQSSRFHSYQVWAKDSSGNVSYWDLWADYGSDNNTGPNVRAVGSCDGDTSIRPIMAVNYANCNQEFESWYNRTYPGWGWDFGFNVHAQYFNGPRPGTSSNSDLSAISTWLPTGSMNDDRRVEASWYDFREHPIGTFYSTQFGEIVSGPNDAVCGTTKTYGSKTYTVLCLEQYIAPTMGTVGFPDNSVQKRYSMTGVVLPN